MSPAAKSTFCHLTIMHQTCLVLTRKSLYIDVIWTASLVRVIISTAARWRPSLKCNWRCFWWLNLRSKQSFLLGSSHLHTLFQIANIFFDDLLHTGLSLLNVCTWLLSWLTLRNIQPTGKRSGYRSRDVIKLLIFWTLQGFKTTWASYAVSQP